MMSLSSMATLALALLTLLSVQVESQSSGNSCDESYDIAVVGAGAAGAYSAYSLRNSRKKIGLFEYSSQIGGRIKKYLLPRAPDVNLEIGSFRFIENYHMKVQNLSQQLGLKKMVVTEGGGRPNRTRFFLRGYSLSYNEVLYGKVPYDLPEDEKNNRHRILDYYWEKLTGYKVADIKKNKLTELDLFSFKVNDGSPDQRYLYQISMDEVLNKVASREGKSFYEDTSKFYSLFEKETSCVSEFMYLFKNQSGEIVTLEQGMQALPRTLVQKFLEADVNRHSLKMNRQLTAIKKIRDQYFRDQYVLSFQPTEYNQRRQTIEILEYKKEIKVCARQVILAIPMFALKQLNWLPLQSGIVAETLSSYNFPTASKVYMTFKNPWWLETYPNRYVNFGDKKTSYRQMYDWKKSKVTGDYVLLASYTDGHKAQYLRHLSNKGGLARNSERGVNKVSVELKDEILDDLAAALNMPKKLIPQPSGLVAQFWADYPYGSLWVEQKAGYPFGESVKVLRKPSITDDVYLVGPDYAWGDNKYWVEGAFHTVDSVISEHFKSFQ